MPEREGIGMGNVEYSAIAAKLKAMYGKFLTREDFEQLMSKKSVGDICGYLKTTPGYGGVLENVSEHDIHRGEMEFLIDQNIVDEYIRIYNFLDSKKRDFLRYWFMRREVEFLKREIRYIYTHEQRNSDKIEQYRFDAFFASHTKIDRETMSKATSLSDCIEACKNTDFCVLLQRAQNLNADFFSMGMMLDGFYYKELWNAIGTKLDRREKNEFKKFLGSKIDMTNLLWIYRGKKYFDIQDEIIFTYLLPVRYALTEDDVKALVESDSIEQFLIKVRETKYGELFYGEEKGEIPEINYEKIRSRTSKSVFMTNPQSMTAIYAYLTMRKGEINVIKMITECVRYGLDTKDVRDMLIVE